MRKGKVGSRLPQETKLEIRRLHAEGKSLMDITRETGVAYDTAKHWINAPAYSVIFPAEEVLALLRARVGQHAIARQVKIPFLKVQAFARAHGYVGPGPRWHPSTKQLTELIDLTFLGQDSISSICRKIGGPYGPVSRLIHKVRKCSAFLTSQTLDSYLPMACRETKIGTSAYRQQKEEHAMLTILDFVRRAAFDGKTPNDTTQLFAVTIGVCLLFFIRENPEVPIGYPEQEKVADAFLPKFQSALETLSMAESGFVH
jgi:hypothetical protein